MATERTVLVRLKADNSQFKRAMREAADSVDTTNDRTAWLAQSILALGPALSPLGAASIPVFTTVATGATMAAAAVGTVALAFNGVGDALKALNAFQLEPTEANLKKLEKTMSDIGPEGEDFVRFLDSLGPALSELANNARGELFPGMQQGLEELVTLLPTFNALIERTAGTVGDLAADGGAALAGEDFEEFFEYLSTDGQQILSDMGRSLGNFFQGFAGLIVAFGPLTGDFSTGLLNMSRDFAAWSQGLDENESFQEFVEYIRKSGPMVLDLLGAFVTVLVDVATAAAPVGDVMVPALTGLLGVVGKLLENPIAPWFIAAAAAMSVYGRSKALLDVTTGGMLKPIVALEGGLVKQTKAAKAAIPSLREVGTNLQYLGQSAKFADEKTLAARTSVRGFAKAAVPAASAATLFAVQATGAAEKVGLSNTAAFAMAGTLAGPWGTAIGAAIGGALDLSHANDDLADAIKRVNMAAASGDIDQMTAGIDQMQKKLKDIESIDSWGDLGGDIASWAGDIVKNPTRLFKVEDRRNELRAQIASSEARRDEIKRAQELRVELAVLKDGYTATAAGIDQATMSQEDFIASLVAANEYLSGRSSLRDYEASLDDLTESIKKNGQTLDITTEKGRANQAALDQIAGTAIKVAQAIEDPALRAKFMDSARNEFIKAARAAGAGKKAAEDLATKVGLLNTVKGKPTVDSSSIDRAIGKANTLRSLLTGVGLNGSNVPFFDEVFPGKNSADGGSVPKTGLPYADRHLYMLADGEEIISNRYGQADQFRADRAAGAIPGYAVGGETGRTPGLRDYIRSDLDMKYPTTLKQWNKALAESTKVLDKERSKREDLLAQADGIRTAITSNYRSDLFGQTQSNPWMSGADRAKTGKGDVFATLTGDIRNANALAAAEKKLKTKGLDSGAFAELVSNASLDEVLAFANGSKADVDRYERLYNQREKSLATAGNVGASVFAPQLAANRAQLREAKRASAALGRVEALLKKNPNATGAAIAKAINNVGPRRR